jgi:hypothetical protein
MANAAEPLVIGIFPRRDAAITARLFRPLSRNIEQKLGRYVLSLVAITLLNRLEEDFGIRLRMQDVFNSLQRLASICEAMLTEQEI